MNIEEQLVSFAIAKRLEEAGYPQYGLYCWAECGTCLDDITNEVISVSDARGASYFIAPTVAELGEALPFFLVDIGELTIIKNFLPRPPKTGWHCSYKATINDKSGKKLPTLCQDKLADCLALMWLKFKEEGLL